MDNTSLNILFFSATVPYPAIDGGRIRVSNLLYHLCKIHKVTFLCFVASQSDEKGLQYLRDIGAEVIGVKWNYSSPFTNFFLLKSAFKPITIAKYYSRRMQKILNSLLKSRNFDILHFEMLHTGQYLQNLKLDQQIKTILDQQNIDSVIWHRLAQTELSYFRRIAFYWQYRSFLKYETYLCKRFDRCLCVSEEDMKSLIEICPDISAEVIPNGVDPDYFTPSEIAEDENQLVFTGSMDWQPNEDAVLFFCQHIFPIIKSELPHIRFFIVGSNPTGRVLDLRNIEGVNVTGLVDDVRPYIAESAVYVVPLRIGGGTRLKILQALAMKKAIVSTSVGYEGLDLEPDRDLIVSDEPGDFAARVIQLLRDKEMRKNLGENGRNLILRKYDWKSIASKLSSVYEDTILDMVHN